MRGATFTSSPPSNEEERSNCTRIFSFQREERLRRGNEERLSCSEIFSFYREVEMEMLNLILLHQLPGRQQILKNPTTNFFISTVAAFNRGPNRPIPSRQGPRLTSKASGLGNQTNPIPLIALPPLQVPLAALKVPCRHAPSSSRLFTVLHASLILFF